ncbi:unnamed protein product [Amoebophrya sp. A120]|nr:unnamed protein product [Amoebophrya sp. A120]|eukprot:GSA120T00005639001.1
MMSEDWTLAEVGDRTRTTFPERSAPVAFGPIWIISEWMPAVTWTFVHVHHNVPPLGVRTYLQTAGTLAGASHGRLGRPAQRWVLVDAWQRVVPFVSILPSGRAELFLGDKFGDVARELPDGSGAWAVSIKGARVENERIQIDINAHSVWLQFDSKVLSAVKNYLRTVATAPPPGSGEREPASYRRCPAPSSDGSACNQM